MATAVVPESTTGGFWGAARALGLTTHCSTLFEDAEADRQLQASTYKAALDL